MNEYAAGMKAPKKGSARAERRMAEREAQKAARDRRRLASLEVGGAPSRPIDVESASVIEPGASAMQCPTCGARVRVEDHAARTVEGVALRVVRTRCSTCGVVRDVYFRIVVTLPS